MEHSLQLFTQQMLFHLLLDNLQAILLYHQIHLINSLNKQHQLVQINQILKLLLLNSANITKLMEPFTHLYISKTQKNQLTETNMHLCKLNTTKKIHLISQLIETIHISIILHNIKMIQKIHFKTIVMNTAILMNDLNLIFLASKCKELQHYLPNVSITLDQMVCHTT